jgi:hypothetical protein
MTRRKPTLLTGILFAFLGMNSTVMAQKCYTLKGTATMAPEPDGTCTILRYARKFPFDNNPNDTEGFYFEGFRRAVDGNGMRTCYASRIGGEIANARNPRETYSLNDSATAYSGLIHGPSASDPPTVPVFPKFIATAIGTVTVIHSAGTVIEVRNAQPRSRGYPPLSFTAYATDLFAADTVGNDSEQLTVFRIDGSQKIKGYQGLIWIDGVIQGAGARLAGQFCGPD